MLYSNITIILLTIFIIYNYYRNRKIYRSLLGLVSSIANGHKETTKSTLEIERLDIEAVNQLRLRIATIELLFLQNTPAPFIEKPLSTITKISDEEHLGDIIDENLNSK